MRKLFRGLMAIILTIGFLLLGNALFNQWQQIPRKDFDAWQIEYASINLDQGENTELKLQVRSKYTPEFKKIALPHIEVRITDANDEVIAIKNLAPQDWLAQDQPQNSLFALKGIDAPFEISSNIPLKIPENSTGYQIRLYYPPSTF